MSSEMSISVVLESVDSNDSFKTKIACKDCKLNGGCNSNPEQCSMLNNLSQKCGKISVQMSSVFEAQASLTAESYNFNKQMRQIRQIVDAHTTKTQKKVIGIEVFNTYDARTLEKTEFTCAGCIPGHSAKCGSKKCGVIESFNDALLYPKVHRCHSGKTILSLRIPAHEFNDESKYIKSIIHEHAVKSEFKKFGISIITFPEKDVAYSTEFVCHGCEHGWKNDCNSKECHVLYDLHFEFGGFMRNYGASSGVTDIVLYVMTPELEKKKQIVKDIVASYNQKKK